MRLRNIILVSFLAGVVFCTGVEGKVDVTKNQDSHIKVWNTIFGFRFGDPIYDGDLPGGHRLIVTEAWWATDTSMQQTLLRGGGVVASFAPIVTDPTNPVELTMAQKLGWLESHFGSSRQVFADLSTEMGNEVHVAVDMAEALFSGMPVPLEYPKWVSWDLAFELTTNRDCPPAPLRADFNLSGTVDWPDFVFFAGQWLGTWP